MSSDNITGRVIAATVIGFIFPTLAVAARIGARKISALKLYADDYLIIAALVFHWAIDISGCILITNGLGRHITTVSAKELTTFLKVQYSGSVLYPLFTFFCKVSIFYQYKRLFSGRIFRYINDAMIVVMFIWCISIVFTGIFICHPIDKSWTPTKPGNCINLVSFYYGLQIPNVIIDAVILVLPLKEVFDLKLPKQQKWGVALTCMLWTVCLVFGIIRLVVMLRLGSQGDDITYIETNAAIWTTIEPTVAIVTACLPSARVLFRSLMDFHYRNHVGRSRSHHGRNFSQASSTMDNDHVLMENPRASRLLPIERKSPVMKNDSFDSSFAHQHALDATAASLNVTAPLPSLNPYARSHDSEL